MRKISIVLVLIFLLGCFSSNVIATEEGIVSPEKLLEIKQVLQEERVTKDDISVLLNKVINKELWDSMNPVYENLEPQVKHNNYEKTVYPDGSYKVAKIEEISNKDNYDGIQPSTIWTRKGYQVSKSWGLVKLGFKVDYYRDDVKKLGRITSQYGYEMFTILGEGTLDTRGFLQGWRNPTNAWYAIYYKAFQGLGSKRYYVKIFVDGNGTWIDSSS